jgi:hypothetical protein
MRKGFLTCTGVVMSAALGGAILATDEDLWKFEAAHGYALAVFVVVDIGVLAFLLSRGSRLSFRLASIWGTVQALVMVADIFTAPASLGLTQAQFAVYLFGLGYYDGAHIAFLFPALFVANVLFAEFAYFDQRGH